MARNNIGRIKAKLGLKGPTKPGEMITRMNQMKTGSLSTSKKVALKTKKKIDPAAIGGAIKRAGVMAGRMGKAFVRNVTGQDIKPILKAGALGAKAGAFGAAISERELPSMRRKKTKKK